jgi:tRNA(Ile)-lysidine synthase
LPAKGPIAIDASAFSDLSDEIALRLLSRIVEWVGNEGPVELGKAEVLCEDLKMAVLEESGRFRRTLAGAMVTLAGSKITVERAPPRRTGAKTGNHRGKAAFTKPR